MDVCLTERTRRVFNLAQDEARRAGSGWIATEHLLLAILLESDGLAGRVLRRLGIENAEVRYELLSIVATSGPPRTFIQTAHLPQSPHVQRVVEWAQEEAREFHHRHVGTEHLLLGLLRESESIAAQVLVELGVRLEDVREEIVNQLHLQPLAPQATPFLDQWGHDRTATRSHNEPQAPSGDVETVMMRLAECHPCVPVIVGSMLQRRGLWNGLAQRFQMGNVPVEWCGTRLIVLPRLPSDTLAMIQDEVLRIGGILPVLPYPHAKRWRSLNPRNRLSVSRTANRFLTWKTGNTRLRKGEVACRLSPFSRSDTLAWMRLLKRKLELHHRFRISEELCGQIANLPAYETMPERGLRWLDAACAQRRVQVSAEHSPEVMRLDQQIQRLDQQKEQAVLMQDFERAFQLCEEADEQRQRRVERLAQRQFLTSSQNELSWDDLVRCGKEWMPQK